VSTTDSGTTNVTSYGTFTQETKLPTSQLFKRIYWTRNLGQSPTWDCPVP